MVSRLINDVVDSAELTWLLDRDLIMVDLREGPSVDDGTADAICLLDDRKISLALVGDMGIFVVDIPIIIIIDSLLLLLMVVMLLLLLVVFLLIDDGDTVELYAVAVGCMYVASCLSDLMFVFVFIIGVVVVVVTL